MLICLAVILFCFTLIAPPAAPPPAAKGANAPGAYGRPWIECGNICWEDERALLDHFAIALSNDPSAIGYITVFDGKRACRKEAEARAIRARDYLVNFRGIEWDRVAWRYGGHRQEYTMFAHLFPRGVLPALPEATVPASESKEDCGAKTHRRPKCPAR